MSSTEWDGVEITSGLYLGSEDAAHADLQQLKTRNITHILVVGFGISMVHPNTEVFLIFNTSYFG